MAEPLPTDDVIDVTLPDLVMDSYRLRRPMGLPAVPVQARMTHVIAEADRFTLMCGMAWREFDAREDHAITRARWDEFRPMLGTIYRPECPACREAYEAMQAAPAGPDSPTLEAVPALPDAGLADDDDPTDPDPTPGDGLPESPRSPADSAPQGGARISRSHRARGDRAGRRATLGPDAVGPGVAYHAD